MEEHMKISTKGRYGIRALIDLAANAHTGQVPLVCIAKRCGISASYLEHVFSALKRAGIVKSVKGAQGGYILAEAPEHITAARIILALEGSFAIECESDRMRGAGAKCETAARVMDTLLWERINDETARILSGVTLALLTEEFVRQCEAEQNMYYI